MLDNLKKNEDVNELQIEKLGKSIKLLQSTGIMVPEKFNTEIMETSDLFKFIGITIDLNKKKK